MSSNEGSPDVSLPPQQLDEWFLDLLACPGCEERRSLVLTQDKSSLLCSCGKYSFPVRDGIPILLVDEAEILDVNATPGFMAGK